MPLTGERASSPIGSASSSADTSVSRGAGHELAGDRVAREVAAIDQRQPSRGVTAIAIDFAAAAKRGSGMTSPSRSRASSVRRVSIAAVT